MRMWKNVDFQQLGNIIITQLKNQGFHFILSRVFSL